MMRTENEIDFVLIREIMKMVTHRLLSGAFLRFTTHIRITQVVLNYYRLLG